MKNDFGLRDLNSLIFQKEKGVVANATTPTFNF